MRRGVDRVEDVGLAGNRQVDRVDERVHVHLEHSDPDLCRSHIVTHMIAAWSPAAWSAIAAWVAVVGVGVSLFFAYRQVREAIQLREAQARPFVVVDFEMDSVLIHPTIENTGLLPGGDAHISFAPPMRSTRDDPWPPEKSTLMTTGIPTLPPRKKYRFFIDTFPERLEAGLPLTYEVKVTYRGSGRKAPFEGTNTLDLTFLVGLGEARRKTLHDLASSVEDIAKRLKGWSKG